MIDFHGFDKDLPRFLRQLERNNNRPWFQTNKDRYESLVREPVLGFIRAIGPRIETDSPHIFVSDSKVGGSMMRPYRDTRFTSGKEPYKTNVGINFRHERGDDAHAPGFWMHIEPRGFWLAAGMWRPDTEPLAKVRAHIAEHAKRWLAARDDAGFRSVWEIVGDSLKRPPRGFDPDHPLIEDIKRKEFLGFRQMAVADLYRHDIVEQVADCFKVAGPYMTFLCEALGVKL